jgi:hypothetical protein
MVVDDTNSTRSVCSSRKLYSDRGIFLPKNPRAACTLNSSGTQVKLPHPFALRLAVILTLVPDEDIVARAVTTENKIVTACSDETVSVAPARRVCDTDSGDRTE